MKRRILPILLVITPLAAATASPAATVTVTSPNGGETWTAGSTHDITWSHTGGSALKVQIILRHSGAVDGCKVRISGTGTALQDESDGAFTISMALPIAARKLLSVAVSRPDLIVFKYLPKQLPAGVTEDKFWLKVFNIGTVRPASTACACSSWASRRASRFTAFSPPSAEGEVEKPVVPTFFAECRSKRAGQAEKVLSGVLPTD